jgi:hypothetical protein
MAAPDVVGAVVLEPRVNKLDDLNRRVRHPSEQLDRVTQMLQPVLLELLDRAVARVVALGLRRDDLVQELALAVLPAGLDVAFAIAIDSRKLPPCCAVRTIMPALGGPSRTSSHSSCVKSALPVIVRLLSRRDNRAALGRKAAWQFTRERRGESGAAHAPF